VSGAPALAALRGVRYGSAAPEKMAGVICPPYDVISPEQQAELYERDPHNAIRLEFGRIEAQDAPGENRYTRAAATWREWLAQGVLAQDDAPSIYPYRQGFLLHGEERRRGGMFCLLRLEEFERRLMLPHEGTLSAPKADRLELMRTCQAQLSPVLALFKDRSGSVSSLLAAVCQGDPLVRAELPGESHALWRCKRRDWIQGVFGLLDEGPFFIADGHHRYESALHYSQETRRPGASPGAAPQDYLPVLCISVANPGLRVLPTHRRATSPGRFLEEQAVRALRRTFEIAPVAVRGADHLQADFESAMGAEASIGCYLPRGRLLILRPRDGEALRTRFPEDARACCDLPVCILHQVVIPDVLGFAPGSPEEAKHVDYRREAQHIYWGVESGQFHLGFMLPPTEPSTVERVASLGQRLPQKSTYFYPKIASGLVFYTHEPHTLP